MEDFFLMPLVQHVMERVNNYHICAQNAGYLKTSNEAGEDAFFVVDGIFPFFSV